MKKADSQSQIVIYQTEDGQARVNVRFEGETVWLSQKLMAELFGVEVVRPSRHCNQRCASYPRMKSSK